MTLGGGVIIRNYDGSVTTAGDYKDIWIEMDGDDMLVFNYPPGCMFVMDERKYR